MTTLTDAIEAEINKGEALCEKATPGPWKADNLAKVRCPVDGGRGFIASAGDGQYIAAVRMRMDICHSNAAFIAETRTAYPAALDLLQRAKGEIEWKPGDEGAKSGELIQAAFEYTVTATGYRYDEYQIVRWDGRYWRLSNGDYYDGPSDELPSWYRPFNAPPALAAPAQGSGE